MARILSLVVLALLPFLTACGGLTLKTEVHPGNLWVGVQPTWAENKKVEGSTYSATSSSGPWGRSTSSTDSTRVSYTLGQGASRQRCYSNESNSVSMNKPTGGAKQVTTQLSVNANCVPDPEQPVPTKK